MAGVVSKRICWAAFLSVFSAANRFCCIAASRSYEEVLQCWAKEVHADSQQMTKKERGNKGGERNKKTTKTCKFVTLKWRSRGDGKKRTKDWKKTERKGGGLHRKVMKNVGSVKNVFINEDLDGWDYF